MDNPDRNNRETPSNLPLAEKKYTGQYPDMAEFKRPWEGTMQVGQGLGKISLDGTPLQSEGFSRCTALVLENRLTKETALFHIDEFDLNHEQEKTLAKMPLDGGLVATFIRGSNSRDIKSRVFNSDLKPLGVITTEDIEVDTGRQHWSLVVKPSNKEVYVNSNSQKKVFIYRY